MADSASFPTSFQTGRLILRPITEADAEPIFHTYARDPTVTRFLTWRPHESLTDTRRYIAHCLATPPNVAMTYLLTGRDDATIYGAMDLRLPASHRLEFGYLLARPHWGQGLMTEALQHVAQWALTQQNIYRVGAVCDVDNPGSARVMQKSGMTLEGLLRRWIIHPNISDQPRDCLAYARVR